MKRALLVMLSATAISVAAGSAAFAGPRHYQDRAVVYGPTDRYCLQGRIWGYPGNCQFVTYGQCAAAASGTDAYCGINPQYAYAPQRYYR